MTVTLSIQKGFTLTELLIAVVILAIGLLGIAGLQAHSIQATSSALNYTHATSLAQDIAESMRANRSAAINGAYNGVITAASPSSSDCIASPCSSTDYEISRWGQQIQTLPGGEGVIGLKPDAEGRPQVQVTISWLVRIRDLGSSSASESAAADEAESSPEAEDDDAEGAIRTESISLTMLL